MQNESRTKNAGLNTKYDMIKFLTEDIIRKKNRIKAFEQPQENQNQLKSYNMASKPQRKKERTNRVLGEKTEKKKKARGTTKTWMR